MLFLAFSAHAQSLDPDILTLLETRADVRRCYDLLRDGPPQKINDPSYEGGLSVTEASSAVRQMASQNLSGETLLVRCRAYAANPQHIATPPPAPTDDITWQKMCDAWRRDNPEIEDMCVSMEANAPVAAIAPAPTPLSHRMRDRPMDPLAASPRAPPPGLSYSDPVISGLSWGWISAIIGGIIAVVLTVRLVLGRRSD